MGVQMATCAGPSSDWLSTARVAHALFSATARRTPLREPREASLGPRVGQKVTGGVRVWVLVKVRVGLGWVGLGWVGPVRLPDTNACQNVLCVTTGK